MAEVVLATPANILDQSHLDKIFQKLSLDMPGNRTFTENGAGAFKSTGSACLDFFSKTTRSNSVSSVVDMFIAAWNEDPELALKVLLNLRDIRGGKGEKKLPLSIMYVLSSWKPLTYLANLKQFINMGCYKDLLVIAELANRCASVKYLDRPAELQNEALELNVISTQLLEDVKALNANESAGISLCAKWAPTEDGHFDRKPLRFSRKLAALQGIKKKEYRIQLVRLRKHLRVLEEMMCNGKWDQIKFDQLPAKAHRLYRKAFGRETNAKKKESDVRKACSLRYVEYLGALTKGEAKIKSTGTQPHELIVPYMEGRHDSEVDATLEGQWKDLVAKLAESGNFKHVQAVCDVSGSMSGVPMQVAIALGLIVSELTEKPFNNKLITFHSDPTLVTIVGGTLRERVHSVQSMPWGGSTDFLAVFKLLLKRAKSDPDAVMVEKLFVFSDMQFNTAGGRHWTSTYGEIKKMYAAEGFEVPKIIFWNLRDSHGSPVEKNEPGTALVSGFSANMMKCFLEAKDIEFNPMDVMLFSLEKYDTLLSIPAAERTPFPENAELAESLGKFDKLVEEHIVPKKSERKRKRRGGGDADLAPTASSSDDEPDAADVIAEALDT